MSKLRTFARWRAGLRAVALLLLLLTAAGCEDATTVGDDLPGVADVTTGAIYIDTVTVRTSTVLVDSVVTSGTGYLLAGRYLDARLGSVEARSYVRFGLAGAFEPDASVVYDSLVLTLSTDSYRYGDTTQVQHLAVHRLTEALRPADNYYAFNSLAYSAAPLASRTLQARAVLGTLRLRLDDALGRELLAAGLNRQLGTAEELYARLPGLALVPGATDNAALLRFSATDGATALTLYYHNPAAPTTPLSYALTASNGAKYFYQLRADRRGTLLSGLSSTRQAISSTMTAAEAYVQGGLGLQLKVEFPYLLNLKALGGLQTISIARLRLESVTGTENRYQALPVALNARLTNRGNQSGALLAASDGTALSFPLVRDISPRTNLTQAAYTLSLHAYLQAVLDRTLANDGLLISPSNLTTPERVVLGSAKNGTNPATLQLYLIRIQ